MVSAVESDIYRTLRNDQVIAAKVGEKIYPTVADESARAPYIVYALTRQRIERCFSAPGAVFEDFDVSVFAETFRDAKEISEAAKNALQNLTSEEVIVLSSDPYVAYRAYEAGHDLHAATLTLSVIYEEKRRQ